MQNITCSMPLAKKMPASETKILFRERGKKKKISFEGSCITCALNANALLLLTAKGIRQSATSRSSSTS